MIHVNYKYTVEHSSTKELQFPFITRTSVWTLLQAAGRLGHYLSRFARGNGLLYDIEFLTDTSGRRVSAFGYWAGYAGTVIALLAWSNQIRNPGVPLPSITNYQLQPDLVKGLKSSISAALTASHGYPRILVIGALGRCGTGAIDACLDAGVPATHIIKWVGNSHIIPYVFSTNTS
jgi:hypothetical protein